MKYMLDTNMCIYIIKKHPQSVLKKFKKIEIGDIGISSITYAELMFGAQKSQHQAQNYNALQEFTAPLEILSFDDAAANQYGQIRAYLQKKGLLIGSLDMLIAAHAQSIQSILVTNNKKEFSRIPHLQIEGWV